jgi:plasmid stabilization system protein ParE
MTLAVILRPGAERDIEIARNWYDTQQFGLGEAFLSAVQERLEAIRQFPEACPKIHKTVRRALVRRFPYLIFYLPSPSKIIVLAVLHTSRNPANWPHQ